MGNDSIKIRTPATVSNVSCGFDCLGYAISEPADIVTVTKTDNQDIEISLSGIGTDKIPIIAKKNTAGKAVLSYLDYFGEKKGFKIHIEKGIHPGSGIGSSAASAVGAAFGVNKLLGSPLSLEELLVHCINGEIVSSGTIHGDNVAPALLGGFILIRINDSPDIVKLPVPKNLISIIVLPEYQINTQDARSILPKNVSLKSAVKQSGNISGFIAGLYESNFELMSRSMVDFFAEPFRRSLIPGYDSIHQAAMRNGAIGCGISGSGPSIFALSDSKKRAEIIGKEIVKGFQKVGLNSKLFISSIHTHPPEILD